ncbi:unnamed protein product [Meloidogyne enterolobii]|uniref:Uncharacterized protein n=1 Tax=Meloidogyne enterolobii TaxID=390850 RepID=A0ACB1AZZ2_MELEN
MTTSTSTQQPTVAQKILFNELCSVFQEIKATYRATKHFVFNKFLRRWRDEMVKENVEDGFVEYRTDDTFYPALRLFVPSKDVKVREFRIKEAKLNQLVCNSIAAMPLNPVPTNYDLLVEKLVNMSSDRFPVNTAKLTIWEVNEFLDGIKYPNSVDIQEEAMDKLCRQCTPNELRFIFHIILGNIERYIDMSAHTLMRTFHAEADNLWKEGDSLQLICEKFADPETVNSMNLTGHLLCKPFRPMLLKRLNYNKYCLAKIIRYCQRPFYLETKYDGEHLIVHKYEKINYKYFTRNGVDYTNKLGRHYELLFSKRIHKYFREEIVDCVLDCELLIWDNNLNCFVGKNRRASDGNVYDPKYMDDDFFENNKTFERSIAVFDILYLNGKCLITEKLTLSERVELLENIFVEEDLSTIFISTKKLINKAEDFVNYYKNAMSQNEEGIVVKSLNSLYRPGSRAEKNGWFKIKPDYGIQSVLDLAVVGVRIEAGHDRNRLKSFLVAAKSCNKNGKEATTSDGKFKFKMIAGITSRLKALDFQRLRSTIGNTSELLFKRPEWIEDFDETSKNADSYRFVFYEKIQVVEVRASGLINGKLQFPAIVGVRHDKIFEEVDSVVDVANFDERLRSRPMIDEDDEHEANIILNKKRKMQQINLKPSIKLINSRETEKLRREEFQICNKLENVKVCVLNANEGYTTQQLQKILIELGAIPIANPTNNTAFLVAMNPKTLNCIAHVKADKCHIVHGNWLLKCKEENKLIPWKPSDLIHFCSTSKFNLFSTCEENLIEMRENTNNKISEEQQQKSNLKRKKELCSTSNIVPKKNLKDKAFERERDESEENERFYEQLAREAEEVEIEIRNQVENQLNSEDCQPVEKGNLFADYVFYLHNSLQPQQKTKIQKLIEMQNGRIVNELNSSITHVVLDKL